MIEIPTIRTNMGGGHDLIKETKPTILVGPPICTFHRNNYNVGDWIKRKEWERIKEAARSKGLELRTVIITLTWRPANWHPKNRYLEIVR